jgi:hypothetical protein
MSINESEIFENNDLYINGNKLKTTIGKIIDNFLELFKKDFPSTPSQEELNCLK